MDIALVRAKVLEAKATRNIIELCSYFSKHPDGVRCLIQIVDNEEKYPLKEYSSWIIIHVCKNKPELVEPFYKKLVGILFKSSNQTVLRNIANIIMTVGIQPYKESELVDVLIGFIQEHTHKVALHVYSMQILAQIVLKHPELKPEIIAVIELNDKDKTPAYNAGKRNFLKKTKQVLIN
ncbi:MAG: hypothetical protein P8N52_10120 [Crocinitomicaceae bacterium]|nr:hypothetical protein [Crocinitomicaceae bacterium]MDG1776894.1 hypothetical protein [Crocinitomicaceae bacterium]